MLFLRVKDLLEGLGNFSCRIAFQNETLPYLAALWWSHQFDLGVVGITGTKDHPLRHDVSKLSWFKVCKYDTKTLSHLLERHKFLKPGSDCAKLSLTQIDLFYVKFCRFGVSSTLNNFSDSKVASEICLQLFTEFRLLGSCWSSFLRWVLFCNRGFNFLFGRNFFFFVFRIRFARCISRLCLFSFFGFFFKLSTEPVVGVDAIEGRLRV